MDAPDIVKCGYLHKKGAFKVGGWKKRYFVLKITGGKPSLAYYRKETDAAPAGEITLDQSTLAYHNVDSKEQPYAFNIKTKGRTYEMFAPSKSDMEQWIEVTMRAALGIVENSRTTLLDVAARESSAWLKFQALGMHCECCWEAVPQALRDVEGVELVRVDAGAQVVSVKRREAAHVPVLVERVVGILEQRFGYLVSVMA